MAGAQLEAQPMALDGPPAPRVGAIPGSPTARALELIERGDTTAAVDFLQASVKRQFKDASAWHLLGLLRWARIAEVRGQTYVRRPDQIREIAAADSSLRIATQLAPDSARYWLSLARFNIRSPFATTLYASQWNVKSAYKSAKANGEVDLLALASDLRGMTMWRRYEAVAQRGFTMENQSISDEALQNVPRDQMADAVSSVLVRPKTFTGLTDYTAALDLFTEATEYEPTTQRYARHLFMALVEREQWPELLSVASRRAQAYPFDHSSRMARGLALHRLQRYAEARAAFDSAFVLMDDTEREWLTSLTRILKQRASTDPRQQGLDSASYRRMSPAQQQAFAQMFWFLNDDVSLSGTSIHHLEFLARVSYADLRFSDEDRGMRGAETDRGDVYIRYGPPDDKYTRRGDTANVSLNWVYNNPKAFFSFSLTPGFASVWFTQTTRTESDYLKESRPVSWSNVRPRAPLDSIPLHVARFRGSRDSTDVVVAAHVPLDSLLGNVEMDELPVLLRVKAMDAASRSRTIDSAMQTVVRPVAAPSREQSWRLRADSGVSILRVEALQPDVDRAARAVSVLAPLATRGFDMSDIMLGSPPDDVTGTAAAPRRWSNAGMTPRTGLLGEQRVLGLLWEVYEPSVRDGAMQYHVDITLRPKSESGSLPPIAALPVLGVKLVERFARAIKQSVRPDGISISYDRAPPVPADGPAVSVEYLSIDLSNQPRGRYELTVSTEDPITRKRSARTAIVVLP